MWNVLKKAVPKALQYGYSVSESIGAATTISLNLLKQTGSIAAAVGGTVLAAGLEFITTYFFSGKVAHDNLQLTSEPEERPLLPLSKSKENSSSESEEEQVQSNTKSLHWSYYLLVSGYTLGFTLLQYYSVRLIYSSLKTIFTDDDVMSDMNLSEELGVSVYFLLFDLAFILSATIASTAKEIKQDWYKHDTYLNLMQNSDSRTTLQNILGNERLQKGIRISGSIAHSLEHTADIVVLLLPLFKWIASLSGMDKIIASALVSTLLAVIFIPVFAETYFFDGREAVNNMQEYAGTKIEEMENNDRFPHLSKAMLTILQKSIMVVGPAIHGVDAAAPAVQFCRYVKAPTIVTVPVGVFCLFSSGTGNAASEALETKRELDKAIDVKPEEVASDITNPLLRLCFK